MAAIKPSLAKGTRDFSPAEMEKRNYIFNTLKTVFKKFGYNEIQTPSFENLSTLTGKYGDEGDKLIFKILNSGDYIDKKSLEILDEIKDLFKKHKIELGERDLENESVDVDIKSDSDGFVELYKYLESRLNFPIVKKEFSKAQKRLIPQISEKALRYDLTVPFARYVVMHQNDIALPFKRFQIQPVWRADRPQRGRYREFYQCDVDVVGSDSLLNEAEFILIYHEALKALGLKDFTIKINNRKILTGIAEIIGKPELIVDMTVAIDKLDKIGLDGVNKELLERGFTQGDLDVLKPIILLEGSNSNKLEALKSVLASSEKGLKGIQEIEEVFSYVKAFDLDGSILSTAVEVDITLARGLNYYTGCIFEVKTNEVAMGSIGGGGRYDDLTGMFGLKDLTGVGVSFGADRIYDVLEELNLYPKSNATSTKLLIVNFDKSIEFYTLPILAKLRHEGIAAELYPTAAKLKKQMSYADAKNIPFVLLVGDEEQQSGLLTLKNMDSGEQSKLTVDELLSMLK